MTSALIESDSVANQAEFSARVLDLLDAGFDVDEHLEFFTVRDNEVINLIAPDPAMFFIELFEYPNDDLPIGFEDYLAEIDFFESDSWEVVLFSPSGDSDDDIHAVVCLDSFIRDQIASDLSAFFLD